MEFPQFISFTVTNACNLRCQMCGQWSKEGYISNNVRSLQKGKGMQLADWKRLVDEIAKHRIRFILVRGGEPFLYNRLMDLLSYIYGKGIFISLDTNGTLLGKYAGELAKLGNMHITFSVDGPENIHDSVRGIKDSYRKTRDSIALLQSLDSENRISKSICFTISRYSYKGLGSMPDVARSMGISSMNIVPYYYVPDDLGKEYEKELKEHFSCRAFSWKGFHHNDSGVDINLFIEQLRKYKNSLNGMHDFPYLPLTEDEYRTWFGDASTVIGSEACRNVESLIDIQPDGSANFCVDYPDYSFGNAMHSTISEMWNSPEAEKFREYRRKKTLAVCHRCGAKYISEIKE